MSVRSGALRRRRKPSFATRLRIFWVFIALTVVIVGAGLYAGYVIVTLPAFHARAVAVEIAGLAVTRHDVLGAADIDRDANVWLVNTGQIERRIEALPYVDRAVVGRSLPAHITITVTEREPAACVRSGTHTITIDRRRRILQAGCARPSAVEIVLTDATLGAPGAVAAQPELTGLLADAHELSAANLAIRSVHEDRFGQLVAMDSAGMTMLFGSDADIAEKAKLVVPVLAAARPGRTIRVVDLRAPATPTVEFR